MKISANFIIGNYTLSFNRRWWLFNSGL